MDSLFPEPCWDCNFARHDLRRSSFWALSTAASENAHFNQALPHLELPTPRSSNFRHRNRSRFLLLPTFVTGEFAQFRFSRRGKFAVSTGRPTALPNYRQVGARPFCRFWLFRLRKLNLDRDEVRRSSRETWSR